MVDKITYSVTDLETTKTLFVREYWLDGDVICKYSEDGENWERDCPPHLKYIEDTLESKYRVVLRELDKEFNGEDASESCLGLNFEFEVDTILYMDEEKAMGEI